MCYCNRNAFTMKTTLLFLIIFLQFINKSFGQKNNDVVSFRLGYSSTNIVFKEAYEPSLNLFGRTFNTGKTFVGDGPEFGISKDLSENVYVDISFSTFKGADLRAKVNNYENYYTLKGYQIPVTINYLLRNSSKKFRVNLGAGVQYLNAKLKQFEQATNGTDKTTSQITDIDISEVQLALRPGVQFRIIPNLFALFTVKVAMSSNGRYLDNPCLSLKYSLKKMH